MASHRHVLRIRTFHRAGTSQQIALLMFDPAERGFERGRLAPTVLGIPNLVDGVVKESRRQQGADERRRWRERFSVAGVCSRGGGGRQRDADW